MDDFEEYAYVPVAERRARARKKIAKLEKAGEKLQPVTAPARGIASTFWGRAWCRNLENYSDYESRLPRGRSYLRNGAVLDLRIEAGEIHAQVMGNELYAIRIRIEPLSDKNWKRIRKACAGGIGSTIDLLQGELSEDVMKVITEPGEGLFPMPQEIRMDCSCPDWADMCKHLAAVLYGVGVRLDEQPELLFRLRQVDHGELIAAAGAAAAKHARSAAKSDAVGLAEADLSAVFGIDLAPPAAEPAPAARKVKRPKTPA